MIDLTAITNLILLLILVIVWLGLWIIHTKLDKIIDELKKPYEDDDYLEGSGKMGTDSKIKYL